MQQLTMTFDHRRKRVRIQKTTLDALGKPSHLIVRYDPERKMLLLQPTTPAGAQAQGIIDWMVIPARVYEQGCAYEFQGSKFLALMRSIVDWHDFAEYRTKGKLIQEGVLFDLTNYDIIMQGKVLRTV